MNPEDWTKERVINDLPRIRRLKGVAHTEIRGASLIVKTKDLRHTMNWFMGLAPLKIAIPLYYGYGVSVAYKYANNRSEFWNPHPVWRRGELSSGMWRAKCVGDNSDDYRSARGIGPHMAVIQQLAMLQTILPETRPANPMPAFLKAYLAIMAVLLLSFIIIKFNIYP